MDLCVVLMDFTKIRMVSPTGINSFERSCYSGHKRMSILTYQTITTPDGKMFSIQDQEVCRRNEVTLLRESGINEALQDCLLIDDAQYYVIGDDAYMLRLLFQVTYSRLTATPA